VLRSDLWRKRNCLVERDAWREEQGWPTAAAAFSLKSQTSSGILMNSCRMDGQKHFYQHYLFAAIVGFFLSLFLVSQLIALVSYCNRLFGRTCTSLTS